MFSEPSEARTVPAKKYITTFVFRKNKDSPEPPFYRTRTLCGRTDYRTHNSNNARVTGESDLLL